MPDRYHHWRKARELTWRHFGRRITFYLPGMFRLNGHTGRYPAVSITAERCTLQCEHCRGKILSGMIAADSPDRLVACCRRLARNGHAGVLISGGCDDRGRLPWPAFLPAIEKIKHETGLFVSVHAGLVDQATAAGLKSAGVDQALVDVIGDDRTLEQVYHLPGGVGRITDAIAALNAAGIPVVPHIVCGLYFGQMIGESTAVAMLAGMDVAQVVIVALMPLKGTAMATAAGPSAKQVADLIAEARLQMPNVDLSLGCARRRGGGQLDVMAIDAGINRMALPSEAALARAVHYKLDVTYQPTCCSVGPLVSSPGWL